ncbi:hydrogenase expression/formation protein [Actibacterium lipolyticum]|uniref:HupH hydrogenase expression protein C-terminal domain-containing protein n=1 Tax=Actibacterium lipolyticum TaxID=1524263 RepID=A0A238JJ18_9RHOB|nr:hydrogenase expression/formation protein [Actibacterium lipolyticum]SMX30678.1 hypothetical protein COL8621_00039 [Actibacterium lipolyticum]
MASNFHLPPTGYGPGSQPTDEDGKELEYMPLPRDMRTYSAHTPYVDDLEPLTPALTLLADVADACDEAAKTGTVASFDLATLDQANRALIAETMGEGEVAVKILSIPAIAAQESVFAGVWVLKGAGVDLLEVAPVPTQSRTVAFHPKTPALGETAPRQPGVVNAPALVAELFDKSAAHHPGKEPHVVNLTLLPHTEEDLVWMDSVMGVGSVTILSRGYGNCRVQATATPHVWRVQFFNSMDTLILDTFEVTDMPEVAIAATEDLSDSGERLREVLEAIR